MESIRKEIEAEIRRARLDKGRLYDLILKIVDASGGAVSSGPVGPVGPVGPQGPVGAAGVCTCTCSKGDKPAAPKVEKSTVVAPKEEDSSVIASTKKVVMKKKTTA
jgi:hypothetical protein